MRESQKDNKIPGLAGGETKKCWFYSKKKKIEKEKKETVVKVNFHKDMYINHFFEYIYIHFFNNIPLEKHTEPFLPWRNHLELSGEHRLLLNIQETSLENSVPRPQNSGQPFPWADSWFFRVSHVGSGSWGALQESAFPCNSPKKSTLSLKILEFDRAQVTLEQE